VEQTWNTPSCSTRFHRDSCGGVHADICACAAGQQQNCTRAVQQWACAVTTRITADAQPVECKREIPAPPPGQALDVEGIGIELTDATSGMRTS
jgi:hypothetical protein